MGSFYIYSIHVEAPTPSFMRANGGPGILWLLARPPPRPALQHAETPLSALSPSRLRPCPLQSKKLGPQLTPHALWAWSSPLSDLLSHFLQLLNSPALFCGTRSSARPPNPQTLPSASLPVGAQVRPGSPPGRRIPRLPESLLAPRSWLLLYASLPLLPRNSHL